MRVTYNTIHHSDESLWHPKRRFVKTTQDVSKGLIILIGCSLMIFALRNFVLQSDFLNLQVLGELLGSSH